MVQLCYIHNIYDGLCRHVAIPCKMLLNPHIQFVSCAVPIGLHVCVFVCHRGCSVCLQSLANTFPTHESTTTSTWSPTTLLISVSCTRILIESIFIFIFIFPSPAPSLCFPLLFFLSFFLLYPSLPIYPLSPPPPLLPLATSNWSADYWNDTGGLSLTFNQTSATPPNATLQYQLAQVFLRDWNSPYAMDIQDYVNLIHDHSVHSIVES